MRRTKLDTEEPNIPLTWNAEGKLVPLDHVERARQKEISQNLATQNQPLPEPRMLSFKESMKLVALDIAHMMDLLVKPPEHLPIVVSAPVPLLVLGAAVFLIKVAWIVAVPALILGIAFRMWVFYGIERKAR